MRLHASLPCLFFLLAYSVDAAAQVTASSSSLMAEPTAATEQDGGRCAARSEDPTRCRTFELTGIYFVEVWNFNGRLPDAFQGGSVAVSLPVYGSLSGVFEVVASRTRQQGPDAFHAGGSALLRRWFGARDRTTFFVEGGFGVSYATAAVPLNGTRFNYLLQAGGGGTRRLGPHAGFIINLRLFHVSNNGLNGSAHNPDVESLGGHVGMFVAF